MSKEIQTYPRTLIDLLQVKQPTPFNISDDFAGVLELIEILGTDRVTTFTTSTATVVSGSTGFQLPLEIPEGQVWILVSISGVLILPDAGDIGQCWLEHNRQNRAGPTAVVGDAVTALVDNQHARFGYVYPRPIIFTPGDVLNMRNLYTGTTSPTTATLRVEYYRFGPESLGSAL